VLFGVASVAAEAYRITPTTAPVLAASALYTQL
jgi:hypothetical protein